MPLTTSDNQFDPSLGGSGKAKQPCWECGRISKTYVMHPAYGYRMCPDCTENAGYAASPIQPVDGPLPEEDDGSEA